MDLSINSGELAGMGPIIVNPPAGAKTVQVNIVMRVLVTLLQKQKGPLYGRHASGTPAT